MEYGYSTILLINMEDSPSINRFTDVFEEKGFSLYHVKTFEEAYQILGSQSVQIIVINMDTDYAKAFRFCYRVKHNQNLKHIFLIALSGAHSELGIYIEAQTAEAKKWLNCDLFIPKPLNAMYLYKLLKKEIAILKGIDGTALDTEKEPWL
ncbi:MAG: hypothetical protein DRO88_06455 [Promethearchaeia archaeon]|nr:MAG: hypothetical protein DRO88_06455 [Candidatus Lokiarchaeia archaeon]